MFVCRSSVTNRAYVVQLKCSEVSSDFVKILYTKVD